MGDCRVYEISAQFNALKVLKKHGTLSKYILSKDAVAYITLETFSDDIRTQSSSYLFNSLGLMISKVINGNPFHLLSWAFQRSRRPAKSAPGAEILSASESIDAIVFIKNVSTKLYEVKIKTLVIVDSKYL